MICGSASFAGFLTLLLLVGCLIFFFCLRKHALGLRVRGKKRSPYSGFILLDDPPLGCVRRALLIWR
jgi:hypothetical protein